MNTVFSISFLVRKYTAPTNEGADARRLLRRGARLQDCRAQSAHALDQVLHPATLQFLAQGDLSRIACLCAAVRDRRRDTAAHSSNLWRALCAAACARHNSFLRMPASPPTAERHRVPGCDAWGWEKAFRLQYARGSSGFRAAAKGACIAALNANTLTAECAEDSDHLRIATECRRVMQHSITPQDWTAGSMKLFRAIFTQDCQVARHLLAAGFGADVRKFYCVRWGVTIQIVGFPTAEVPLLQWTFFKIRTAEDEQRRALFAAMWALLLRAGFGDVNATSAIPGYRQAGTMLHDSIVVNDHDSTSMLLAAGANANALNPGTQAIRRGASSLGIALEYADLRMIKLLVAAGADVNRQSPNTGRWPATDASLRGQGDVLATLIAGGASLRGEQGFSCMRAAAVNGHHHLIAQLSAAGAPTGAALRAAPLHLAATFGHHRVVSDLAAAGADVNISDCMGEAALHSAACSGHTAVVAALVAAGARVDATNRSFRSILGPRRGGLTALGVAAYHGHALVVQQLIDAGADIRAGAVLPLAIATSRGHVECSARLRTAGACTGDAGGSQATCAPSPLADELASVERALRGTWEYSKTSAWRRLKLAVLRTFAVCRDASVRRPHALARDRAWLAAFGALVRADVAGRSIAPREYNNFRTAAVALGDGARATDARYVSRVLVLVAVVVVVAVARTSPER